LSLYRDGVYVGAADTGAFLPGADVRQRIEITNHHATPIAVEVLDRVPVSRSADIHVEVLSGATEPTVKDFDGKADVPVARQLQETDGP